MFLALLHLCFFMTSRARRLLIPEFSVDCRESFLLKSLLLRTVMVARLSVEQRQHLSLRATLKSSCSMSDLCVKRYHNIEYWQTYRPIPYNFRLESGTANSIAIPAVLLQRSPGAFLSMFAEPHRTQVWLKAAACLTFSRFLQIIIFFCLP
jgi:hypothetical protein